MALAWNAGWGKPLRGSNPLSSAVVREENDAEFVPQFESGGQTPVPLSLISPFIRELTALIDE